MRKLVWAMFSAARSSLKSRRELALENLALRQQLAVLRRPVQRPQAQPGGSRVLLKLGFVVREATVSRLMPRRFQPPSQTWGTFLANHLPRAAAIDLLVADCRHEEPFPRGITERPHLGPSPSPFWKDGGIFLTTQSLARRGRRSIRS